MLQHPRRTLQFAKVTATRANVHGRFERDADRTTGRSLSLAVAAASVLIGAIVVAIFVMYGDLRMGPLRGRL